MADRLFGSSSSNAPADRLFSGGKSGGRTIALRSSGPPKKKKHGLLGKIVHGPLDLGANLGKDVADTAVGIGPGIYETGKALYLDMQQGTPKRSKKIAKGIGQQYAFTYGPLLHGDIGKTAGRIYQHPLQPLLDAATIATAGAGAASKVGLVSKGRSVVEIGSPAARAGEVGAPVAKKLTSAKPLVRARQQAVNKALNKIEYKRGKFSVDVPGYRYGKAIRRDALQGYYSELPHYRNYVNATKGLSKEERIALNLRARDVHPGDLTEFWKGTDLESVVSKPKVQALVLNPSKKLLKAEAASRRLSLEGERLFKQQGLLHDAAAAERPNKFKLQVEEALGRPVRPVTGNPYYMPDVPRPVKTESPYAAMGGGKGVAKNLGSTKQNKGILAGLAKLDIKNDVLGPEFIRRTKFKTHTAIHDALLKGAVKKTAAELDQMGGVPDGWDFVRKPIVSKTGNISAQKISTTRKIGSEQAALPQDLRQLVPNPNDLHDSKLSEGFGAKGLAEDAARGPNGEYYIVPKTTIRAAAGEFHRTSKATRVLIEKPLTVWRHLILGTRLAFLTNNVVGNHLMYAIRAAGPDGLKSYLHALQDAKGKNAVRQLLDDPATSRKLGKRMHQQLMDEFFPEHVEGTFGRTQGIQEGVAKQKARSAALGIIPATQSVAENIPRKALAELYIRRSPEFKALHKTFDKQTRSFERTTRQLMAGEKGALYQRRISDKINQTLGNYLNMSPAERGVIRNIIPFYAWYKAIFTTTFHLAADTPGRALALSMLGEIGKDDAENLLGPLPSYLKGAIPIGKHGDIGDVVTTQGFNPWATIAQVGRGSTTDVASLGLNPFLMALMQTYANSADYTHGPKISPGGLAKETLGQIVQGLPPARLAHPPGPSKLYPQRDFWTELLSQSGFPRKKVSLPEAKKRAARGD